MLRRLFQWILVGSLLAMLAAWIISADMVESWVYAQYRDVESALAARERLWLLRAVTLPAAIGAWLGLRRWPRTEQRLQALAREFRMATRLPAPGGDSSKVRSFVVRAAMAAWLVLALVHWEAGARKAIHEWPVYEFAPGDDVLPNMSTSNRDVIRCLQEATEERSRILCFSDQTLYFVSYYAWPRVVLQRVHPDSEFVVPQEGLSERRAAYRLNDFTDGQLADWAPDYVLDYYASPEFVAEDPLDFDPRMIAFLRHTYDDPAYLPECPMRLRRIAEVRRNP